MFKTPTTAFHEDTKASKSTKSFSYRSVLRVLRDFVMSRRNSSSQRLRLSDRDGDRPADLAIDDRVVAVVVRLAAPEIERHQVGDDVLARRARRQIAHARLRERRIEDRAARLLIHRRPAHAPC